MFDQDHCNYDTLFVFRLAVMACVSGRPKGFRFDGIDIGCFLSVELVICSIPIRDARLRPRMPEHRRVQSTHGSLLVCTAAHQESANRKTFHGGYMYLPVAYLGYNATSTDMIPFANWAQSKATQCKARLPFLCVILTFLITPWRCCSRV